MDLQKASWIVFDVILRDAGMLLVVVEQDQRLLDGLINVRHPTRAGKYRD